jgi:hypothetical protein
MFGALCPSVTSAPDIDAAWPNSLLPECESEVLRDAGGVFHHAGQVA